MFLYILI